MQKEETLENQNSEDEKQKVWNKLLGLKPYSVIVTHNFWSGSRYEASFRPITILAESADEARQFAIENLELVEEHFRSKKVFRGKRKVWLIRRSETYRLKEIDIKGASGATWRSGTGYNPQGEYVRYG